MRQMDFNFILENEVIFTKISKYFDNIQFLLVSWVSDAWINRLINIYNSIRFYIA